MLQYTNSLSPKTFANTCGEYISMSSVSFERWLLDQNVLFDATAIEFVVVSNTTTNTPNATTKVLGKRRIHHREKIIIRIPFQACFTFETSALFARMNEKARKRRWKKRLEYVLKKRKTQSSISDWLSALTLALCFERFCISQSERKQLQQQEQQRASSQNAEKKIKKIKETMRSRFEPYLKTLSECERHAMCNWEEGEKELLLRGTDVGMDYVRDEREAARREYESFRAALLPPDFEEEEEEGEEDDEDNNFAEYFTFERYRGARSVCSSRAFQIAPRMVGLMPLADLFNHKSVGNDVAVCEGDKTETVAVSVVKQSGVQKGEELFNTYGVLSNTDLLNSYGFCDKSALDVAATAPRITGLSVRQRFLMMAKTSKLPDAFREDEETHTIEEITRLLPPGREDILRSVFLHRLKLYPSQKEFERACEAYLLSGGGDLKNTRENASSLKRERVELARICRQSEMNCLERAIEKLSSKAVLAQDREDDAMFSVFA